MDKQIEETEKKLVGSVNKIARMAKAGETIKDKTAAKKAPVQKKSGAPRRRKPKKSPAPSL